MTAGAESTIRPASDAFRRAGGVLSRLYAAYGAVGVPFLITAAAAFVRFWRLGHPHAIIPLDETYYAPNSLGYVCHGVDMGFKEGARHTCGGMEPVFVVHPPVGKLLIAVGIKIFGYRPFGWRFSAALVGSLSVLVIYLIGRRLWENRWAAAAAAVLLGVEGLQFVQSRIAMLDIFVSFFILVGIWLMLEDRARAPTWSGPRWWRLGAGVAFGLALASKWSALFVLPVVAAVTLAWEVVRIQPRPRPLPPWWRGGVGLGVGVVVLVIWGLLGRLVLGVVLMVAAFAATVFWEAIARRGRASRVEPPPDVATHPPELPEPVPLEARALRDKVPFQILAIGATFALIPLIVYMASYTPWFLSTKRYVPPRCYVSVEGKAVAKRGLSLWLCDQREIYEYHKNLKATDAEGKPIHPYLSKAWSWPWISRPASHFYERYCAPGHGSQPCAPGQQLRDEEVLGLPNPLIWWTGFFIALPVCIFWMIMRRDEVAALLVVLFAPLVLPWFVTSRPLFMFYMTPASPLIVLMVVHMLQRWKLRWTAVWFVGLAVVLFGYFYPVLAAYPVAPTGVFGWESRIWFGHGRIWNRTIGDCTSKGVKILCWI
jgi:dolichyl-phosphate-mannose-protein mannosyltransferase